MMVQEYTLDNPPSYENINDAAVKIKSGAGI